MFNSPLSRTVQINEFASVVFHGGKSENDYIKESERFSDSREIPINNTSTHSNLS